MKSSVIIIVRSKVTLKQNGSPLPPQKLAYFFQRSIAASSPAFDLRNLTAPENLFQLPGSRRHWGQFAAGAFCVVLFCSGLIRTNSDSKCLKMWCQLSVVNLYSLLIMQDARCPKVTSPRFVWLKFCIEISTALHHRGLRSHC